MYRRQAFIAVIAALLVVSTTAACGSDDDGADSGAETAPSSADASSDADGADEAVSNDVDDDSGDNVDGDDAANTQVGAGSAVAGAVVNVNGEEFVLDQEIVCVSLGGAVGGSFASSVDDVSFDVSLPPEDWESRPASEEWGAPSVRLDDDRADAPVSWRAGGEVVDGLIGVPPEVAVTAFSSDEGSGSGTATVVEINRIGIDGPVVTAMTFEFSCE